MRNGLIARHSHSVVIILFPGGVFISAYYVFEEQKLQ